VLLSHHWDRASIADIHLVPVDAPGPGPNPRATRQRNPQCVAAAAVRGGTPFPRRSATPMDHGRRPAPCASAKQTGSRPHLLEAG